MDAYRIAFKFFFDNPASIDRQRLVPMFHLWIRDQGLASHLLIDVADYLHIHKGPGVVLVAHEANISIDDSDGELGLLYQRKRPYGNDLPERMRIALSSTLEACLKFEHDPAEGAHVKFRTDEFVMRIQDRLLAPNTAATMAAVKPALEALVSKLYGVVSVQLEHSKGEEKAFEVQVKTGSNRSVADLMDRIGLAMVG